MSPFDRLGRFVHRRRLLVLAAWALVVFAAVPFAPQVPDALRAGGFSLDDLESARARQLLGAELGLPPSGLAVVYHSDTLQAGTTEWNAATAGVIAALEGAQHVVRILPHQLAPNQVSADGRTAYDLVFLDLPPDSSPEALPILEPLLRAPPGIAVALAGGPAFYGDVQRVSEEDLRRSELISLPLAALALLLVFGSLVAAAVPLAVGGASVLVALAVIFVVASLTPMSIFVLNLATLLGLGLGVDYSLLMTSRFREELAARDPTDPARVARAVEATVATAGRAVFFSGLTVLLGLIGLVLFDFMILRSVGIAGAVVVGLAVLAALTLLPAILSLVGGRIDALAVRKVTPPAEGDGAWARLARRVMRHPILVLIPTLGLLLVLGAPFLHVRFNAPDATILPMNVPSRASYELLAGEFGEGEFAPLTLAVRTPGAATEPGNIAALHEWSRRLAADPRITRVESLVDVDPRLTVEQYQLLYDARNGPPDRYLQVRLEATTRGDLTAFTLYTPYGPNHPDARALVADLRAGAAGAAGTSGAAGALAPPPGTAVLVGGGAAEVTDVVSRIAADFPRSALFIVISTYIVLFLLLRSLVLPAKALLMNALSITASFGALVWIFQDGNLSALLGFQPLGFVETSQPVILFCVLFGLSMDYEVFLLSRMREAWDRTGDNREAVATGLERSGQIVTSAALIVVVVAASFVFADIVLIKALGLGIAIAVALDATVVRALLVPATMRLLGDWNWWLPARLKRLVGTGITAVVVVALVAACTPASGPIFANPPVERPTPLATPTPTARPADPQPVAFPRDDGPHDRLTEWWYYTGHLRAVDGAGAVQRFGFEFVIFRAERGSFPVSWASHLALTDETGNRFLYAQRTEIGNQVDTSPRGVTGEAVGFDLTIRGLDPSRPAGGAGGAPGPAWEIAGSTGLDRLTAAVSPEEAAAQGIALPFGLNLTLAAERRPVLHDEIGWLDFGPAGSSYYYSRTRMAAEGEVTLGDVSFAVEGTAWFDHQWGDFISVGAGGWDWFAVNLADGTDLTISIVRDRDDRRVLVYGTLVRPEDGGTAEHLDADEFTLEETATWTSPHTGAVYPAGWRIEVPAEALVIELAPTVADQELDTRSTTGVVYWEGSQVVRATRDGSPLEGEAYVELTGYGAAEPAAP